MKPESHERTRSPAAPDEAYVTPPLTQVTSAAVHCPPAYWAAPIRVRLVTAIDGVDALEKVQQHNPDLILLDIMMPRMSGFQVCRRLKGDQKTRDIQILMVTALNELGDIEQASECGTDDFVSKPVNKLELLTRVKSLLRVRHMKSELERALTYLNEIEHDEETL